MIENLAMHVALRYRRLAPGDPFYEQQQLAPGWFCDAYDHNEPPSCPNPQCFKHRSVVE